MFYKQFHKYKANSLKNNNKQVISCTDTAGPWLPTKAVSIMQRVFGSDHLLGTIYFRF